MTDIRFAGQVGSGPAGDAVVRELLPLLERLAGEHGWAAVLNATVTLSANLGVRHFGEAAVAHTHRLVIEALPQITALAAANGRPAGEA